MRKLLLFTLITIASYSFSQVLTITDENGTDVTNTTITYDLLSSEIMADNDLNIGFDGHINNISSSTKSVTILREVETIPAGAESYFCTLGACVPPNVNKKTGDVAANSQDVAQFHYVPRGNITDATVVWLYTYEGGTQEARLTLEYHVIDDTGINSQLAKNSFLAYPNPANQNVSISYNVSERSEIIFYNIVGKQVKSILVDAGTRNIEVETSSLPSGTYFYSMISNSKITETKRLVIKH